MYFDYLRHRGSAIALGLAILAIITTASYEDFLSGLAVVGILYFAFPAAVAFGAIARWTEGRHGNFPSGWRRQAIESLLLFAGVLVTAVLIAHQKHSWSAAYDAFRVVGATLGTVLIIRFAIVGIPRWASSRRDCPDCASSIDGRASVCPNCGFRWDTCLVPKGFDNPLGQLLEAVRRS